MKKKNVKGKILSIALVILLISSLTFVHKVEAVTKCYVKLNKIEGKKDNILENILNISKDIKKGSSDDINDHEIYIVQAGDTLFKISSKYNIAINNLKKLNSLTDDTIYVGQALSIINNVVDSNDKIILNNPADILVLVNKKNKLPSDYNPNNLVIPNVPFPFKSYHDKKLMRIESAMSSRGFIQKSRGR